MSNLANNSAQNADNVQIPSVAEVRKLISEANQGNSNSLQQLRLYYRKCKVPKTESERAALNILNDFIDQLR